MPNGLPMFSALQNVPQDAGGYNNYAPDTASPDDMHVEQAVPPDVPDPFDAGGAVPPEQTAAADSYHAPSAEGVIADVAELKDRLVSELKVQDTMLATSLMGTSHWTLCGDTVTVTVESEFLQKQLDAQKNQVSAHLSRLAGKNLRFVVHAHVQHQANPMQSATEEVKILCNAFRGSIVSVIKKDDAGASPVAHTPDEKDNDEADAPSSNFDAEMMEDDENDESL